MTAPAAARRLDRWKLSLLDLTLRNRLLDARDGRQVVPLAGVDAVALAARLDDGAPLELGTTAVIDPAAVGGAERAAEAMAKAGADALAHGRLLAALAPDELDRRLVAMARSANPDSASCQFYILKQAKPSLNGQYAVFGMVVGGLNTVYSIGIGDRIISAHVDEPVQRNANSSSESRPQDNNGDRSSGSSSGGNASTSDTSSGF